MTKRNKFCDACVAEELRLSAECIRLEEEATARGETHECECPLVPCDTDPDHGKTKSE